MKEIYGLIFLAIATGTMIGIIIMMMIDRHNIIAPAFGLMAIIYALLTQLKMVKKTN